MSVKGLTSQMRQDLKEVEIDGNFQGQMPRIIQCLGNAPASKGYHGADGKANGKSYCVAVDFSVETFVDENGVVDKRRLRWFLYQLARNGFVGFARLEGVWENNQHVHAIYVRHTMKPELESQVVDWLKGYNGLARRAREHFWQANEHVKAEIQLFFNMRSKP